MKTVALVTGGFTGESVISFRSAQFVLENIDPKKYSVYKVIISPEGWYCEDKNNRLTEIDKNDFSLPIPTGKVTFDSVFIMLHGSPGEDGKLQSYFEMLNIPYVGCDALTSALTMNKGYTKAVVAEVSKLYVAKSVQLLSDVPENIHSITSTLKFPLFVKTNNGGSSIGMSKVKTADELPEALNKAFAEDSQVLVEEFINGREFTVGIFSGKNGITVLPATEVISSKEFFDFEAKYTPGITEEITPARMTPDERKRVEEIVIEVYKKLNCKGMVRIDYFLEEGTDNFYFVEINTIPGQTETSFIPQQVAAAGIDIQDFYTDLLDVALGESI